MILPVSPERWAALLALVQEVAGRQGPPGLVGQAAWAGYPAERVHQRSTEEAVPLATKFPLLQKHWAYGMKLTSHPTKVSLRRKRAEM